MRHVLNNTYLKPKWTLSICGPQVQWNKVVAEEWRCEVDKLAGDLCLLGFLASGPGGQGKEWVGMLAMNDQNDSQSVYWNMEGPYFLDSYIKVSCLFFCLLSFDIHLQMDNNTCKE
jgi:hypothetical protein